MKIGSNRMTTGQDLPQQQRFCPSSHRLLAADIVAGAVRRRAGEV
jgi:hypothetical protein